MYVYVFWCIASIPPVQIYLHCCTLCGHLSILVKMCIHVCVYKYMYIYIYNTYKHVHVGLCVLACIKTCFCMHACLLACMHVSMSMFIYICIHAHIRVCVYIYTCLRMCCLSQLCSSIFAFVPSMLLCICDWLTVQKPCMGFLENPPWIRHWDNIAKKFE